MLSNNRSRLVLGIVPINCYMCENLINLNFYSNNIFNRIVFFASQNFLNDSLFAHNFIVTFTLSLFIV